MFYVYQLGLVIGNWVIDHRRFNQSFVYKFELCELKQ